MPAPSPHQPSDGVQHPNVQPSPTDDLHCTAIRDRLMNAALDTASAWTDTAFVARHIAARAGVSSQTFYKHYGGAQQLLHAAFDRELAWLTNPEQARAGNPTASAALRHWLDRLLHYIAANGDPKAALDQPGSEQADSPTVRSRLAAALDQLLSACAAQADHPTSRDATDVLYVIENIWHAADARGRYATAHRLLDALLDDLTCHPDLQLTQGAAEHMPVTDVRATQPAKPAGALP